MFFPSIRRPDMNDLKNLQENRIPLAHDTRAHPDGRRCCGRPLSEKCGPGEEAAAVDPVTGKKSCCKGHHKH